MGIEVVKCCGWARKGSFRLVVVIVNAGAAGLKGSASDCVREQSGESVGHGSAVKIDCGERVLATDPEGKES
jgi:hypothetical protein